MEKKNTILLTVIAIATLLVAVVGATFAYFTASVTTDKENGNNTVDVKTYALASAKMTMGDKVEANGVYPGWKDVKSVTVTGECPSGQTCEAVNAVISVTPTIPAEFGTDVTWKLYESETAITCTHDPQTTGGKYLDNSTCTIPETAKVVIDNGGTAAKTYDVSVTSTTNTNYYLVVEYANDETLDENGQANQNAQQNQGFTVAIDFASK